MAKVVVIGDLIEDIFIFGTSDRLNPEGPTPLVRTLTKIKKRGGAGNVYENLNQLGVQTTFIHPKSQPSRKTRIISDNNVICRLDDDRISKVVTLDYSKLECDYLILSDYNKGALRDCKEIISSLKAKVFVDPKKAFSNYTGAYCIKANRLEFEKFYGEITDENVLKFAKENRHEIAIVTIGKDGLVYCYEGKVYRIPSVAKTIVDVIGAGDCFLAALVYAFTEGHSVHKAIEIANLGAAAAVQNVGTYALKKQDLIRKVIFTNGCFDVLHRGHLELLESCKSMGDYLIVGLNSDNSVKKLKGEGRPINSQEDRKKALESLKFVDEVIIFDEETPYELIKSIKPDIIVKGGDYRAEDVVGNDLCEVRIVPLFKDYSTTKIIEEYTTRR